MAEYIEDFGGINNLLYAAGMVEKGLAEADDIPVNRENTTDEYHDGVKTTSDNYKEENSGRHEKQTAMAPGASNFSRRLENTMEEQHNGVNVANDDNERGIAEKQRGHATTDDGAEAKKDRGELDTESDEELGRRVAEHAAMAAKIEERTRPGADHRGDRHSPSERVTYSGVDINDTRRPAQLRPRRVKIVKKRRKARKPT